MIRPSSGHDLSDTRSGGQSQPPNPLNTNTASGRGWLFVPSREIAIEKSFKLMDIVQVLLKELGSDTLT